MATDPPPRDVRTEGPGLLARLDRAGTIEVVSPALAAALHAEPRALAGRAFAEIADAPDREAVRDALAGPQPEGTHRFAGGRVLAWRATRRAADDAALLLAAWDVTALRDEADALGAELDALLTTVGHDLRAPVRAIDGFADALLGGAHAAALPEDTRRFLGLLRGSGAELAARLDALLAAAGVARAPLHRRADVDVAALAREVIDYVLVPRADGRDVTWVVGELPPAHADPALLRRLLLALLDNALRHTEGTTRIELAYDAAYVVRDDGPGFDPALAEQALTGHGPGTGLPVAVRIARRHGGRLWAERAPESGGAAVLFTLGEA